MISSIDRVGFERACQTALTETWTPERLLYSDQGLRIQMDPLVRGALRIELAGERRKAQFDAWWHTCKLYARDTPRLNKSSPHIAYYITVLPVRHTVA